MATGRILLLVIATIMILGFSQARYIVNDESIEDLDQAAMTDSAYKLEINEQNVEYDSFIMTIDDQLAIIYESTIEKSETTTDEDDIEPLGRDVHEAGATGEEVPLSLKTMTTTGVPRSSDRGQESLIQANEISRTDRANKQRSQTRHRIFKRDPPQWMTQQYG